MEMSMRTTLFLLFAALTPGPALAANQVALANHVFVERVSTEAEGKPRILLEEQKVVVPGDRLVFVLNYRNAGVQPADKIVITNSSPSAVRIDRKRVVVGMGGYVSVQLGVRMYVKKTN